MSDPANVPPAPPPPPPPPPGPAPRVAPARAGGGGAITPAALATARTNLRAPPGQSLFPAPAFAFKVVFGESSLKDETSFYEVSGIGSSMETESVTEGGENRYIQLLPTGVKNTPLVLKRGVAPANSALVKWCRAVMEGGLSTQVLTAPLTVYLLDAEGLPVRAWQFADAFPLKWEFDPFNASKNEVAIEKITLGYTYFQRLL